MAAAARGPERGEERCSVCGAALGDVRVLGPSGLARASCLGCGIQLVRRGDGCWGEIRG